MRYDGGKNGAGVWQTILNEIPQHRVSVELFGGSAAVTRRKRPAVENIVVEIDPVTIAAVKPLLSAVHVIQADALEWLAGFAAVEDVFIYADPPYLKLDVTGAPIRRSQDDLYRCEFATVEQHTKLLQLAQSSPAMWIISGYWSQLYADMLKGWRVVKYQAQSRVGMRDEYLWCNFTKPIRLHDYRAIGSNRTERQRIKRKKERWKAALLEMTALERNAVFEACQEAQSELAARPAVEFLARSLVVGDGCGRRQSELAARDPQTELAARTAGAVPLPCL